MLEAADAQTVLPKDILDYYLELGLTVGGVGGTHLTKVLRAFMMAQPSHFLFLWRRSLWIRTLYS